MSVLQAGKIEWSLAAARFSKKRWRTVPTVEGANDAVG